jgi:hypothetical protein
MEIVELMPEWTHNRESEINTSKASACLPGLDIEIIHRQSLNSEWEQVSINIREPSFEIFEAEDPFTLWVQATSLMWMPWLTAQTMMLPNGWPRMPPNVSDLSKGRRRVAVSE